MKQKNGKNINRLTLIAQIGLLMGPFLTMMDSNIVTVALPNIALQLNRSETTMQWIISGYLLALAAVLAASAYLAKRFGTLRIYLISMVGFTVGSILCAISNNFEMLLVARILQGMFGAPMLPLAMEMLLGGKKEKDSDIFNTISPLMGIVLFLAPALGPTIGGLLIQISGWQLIFWINVPIGIIGFIATLKIPHTFYTKGSKDVKFDPLGLLFLSGGLALLTFGTSNIPLHGGLSLQAWPYWASGALLILIYIIWSYNRKHPVVNLRLLKSSNAAISILICTLAAVIMFSMLVLIPVFMQKIQEHSVLVTGLALFPQSIVTGLGTILGNKLPKRVGIRKTVILGMFLVMLGTVCLQLVDYHTSVWEISALLIIRGFAVGLVIQPLLMELIGSLPSHETTDGNTLFNIAQRIGGAVGIAILVAYFQTRELFHLTPVLKQFHITSIGHNSTVKISDLPVAMQAQVSQAMVNGFHDSIWLLTGLSIIGFLLAFFLKSHKSLEINK